jgi:hypothetical protein
MKAVADMAVSPGPENGRSEAEPSVTFTPKTLPSSNLQP